MEAELHSGTDAPARRNNSMAGKRGKASSEERRGGNQGPRHGEYGEEKETGFHPILIFVEK